MPKIALADLFADWDGLPRAAAKPMRPLRKRGPRRQAAAEKKPAS